MHRADFAATTILKWSHRSIGAYEGIVVRLQGRYFVPAIGIALFAFGLGCWNYTKAEGLEHHRRQAAKLNLPEPSPAIRDGGLLTLILGAGLIGSEIGYRRGLRRINK